MILTVVLGLSCLILVQGTTPAARGGPQPAIAGSASPDQSGATATPDQSGASSAAPPAATPAAAATPAPSGTILASDNFSNPTGGLFTSGSNATWTWGYVSGDYQIASVGTVVEQDKWVIAAGDYTDVIVTADVHQGPTASGTVDAGVGCRVSGGSSPTGYRFRYDFGQGFWLLQRLDPGNAVRLGQGQMPGAPIGSATHHLKLTCQGGTITAFVDGVQAGSAQDSSYPDGSAMLLARAAGNDTAGAANGQGQPTKVDVRFDNFALTQP